MNEPIIKRISISNVIFGKNVKIIEPVNIYKCEIGDNTFIGPFVEIQSDVKIGKNCKIQSHSFICSMTTIGDNTVIAHGVIFINDLFSLGHPANGDRSLWKPVTIGNNVSIGSNATILPVEICDNVVIGAAAVVTKDIRKPGIYAGNPARKMRDIFA
jgi:acetyltransferase-like isoleucine patch superfamily enzyme